MRWEAVSIGRRFLEVWAIAVQVDGGSNFISVARGSPGRSMAIIGLRRIPVTRSLGPWVAWFRRRKTR